LHRRYRSFKRAFVVEIADMGAAVGAPSVTKRVRSAPNTGAAYSCASLIGPTGSSSESRPLEVADVSARKMFSP
jgi:hypothetical protein